jgi:RNA polymerase sigma factor (sigma-70 family)
MAAVVPHPRVELERLYAEHGERVRAICGSILRNRHEAEDAAQQVFVAALRALRGGTVPRDGGAWLATIARHESWVRARHNSLAALPEDLEDRAQEDPANTVVRRAELAETWETIAALPASQREALLLREVRGLDYDELADDLSLSHASVRSLLNRARTTLRMQLERGVAVLTGAQWVSALARLFDSASSSPALPSVTRAAAVGLGALAIAGGAVTASMPSQHTRPRPLAHASSPAGVRPAAFVSSHRGARSAGRVEDGRHRGEHRGSTSETSGRDSSGSGSSGDDRSSSGAGPSSSTSGTDGGHSGSGGGSGSDDSVATTVPTLEPTSSTSGHDGGTDGGSSSGEVSGGSSDPGSSGSSGSSEGSSASGSSSGSGSSDPSP